MTSPENTHPLPASHTPHDVIVIGAGAAGMMCAAQAGQRGRRVLLIDHAPRLAEKIRISGGGRCNFTNLRVTPENFLCSNPHFVRSALARYTPAQFIELVERYGISYHEKAHGQLFCDDSSRQIIDMLCAECEAGDISWARPLKVESIWAVEHDTLRYALATPNSTYVCESLVIATGGLSIPKIGATPFGYHIAEQFGLQVVQPRPALVPLTLSDTDLQQLKPLAGISTPVEIECGDGMFREAMLVTHRGLSGPAILQISNYWQWQDADISARKTLRVNLLPGEDVSAWLHDHAHGHMQLANLLARKLPKRFAQAWCALQQFNGAMSDYSANELQTIAEHLTAWQITPAGTQGYAKAEVTLGGVDTRALSSKTMEANKQPGLFFIGEVMDVTGHLGGFNFQWAWASGHAAGQHV